MMPVWVACNQADKTVGGGKMRVSGGWRIKKRNTCAAIPRYQEQNVRELDIETTSASFL